MGYKFNPFTGTLDTVDSPNGVFEELDVNGDIVLDDGGTYTTTVQCVTPTANRTISFPDATGTVGLVAGSSGQLVYNNAGAYAGVPSTVIGATGDVTLALNGAASTPPLELTGTWFTGGTSTTTKPQVLIEPTGTTSTAWSTSGTGLGVNAASGFTGRLLDLQLNGTSNFNVDSTGRASIPLASAALPSIYPGTDTNTGLYSPGADQIAISANGLARLFVSGSGVGINTAPVLSQLSIGNQSNFALSIQNPASSASYIYFTRSSNATDGRAYIQSDAEPTGFMAFGAGGGERLRLDSTGSVRVVTGLTVATLPGTPAVGMIARVTDASAPAMGAIVAGGGAAAALVWYNGTNWRVIGV
jgi:hypothetical protein